MKDLIFLRHIKSKGNIFDFQKGTRFIGRQEFDILLPKEQEIDFVKRAISNVCLVFSSPSKRCKQTLELITKLPIIQNKNLYEIDYGDADGMHLKEIKEKFSYLFEGWKKGEDPRFPNGENTFDVFKRYKHFVSNLDNCSKDKILICTHNVFLRSVLGDSLNIPMEEWFKISIPHFEPINFCLSNGKLNYSGSQEQKKNLLKNYS